MIINPQKRYNEFLARYEEPKTRALAKNGVDAFNEFLNGSNNEINENEIYQTLGSFVQWLYTPEAIRKKERKNTGQQILSTSTVKVYVNFVRAWLRFNGIKLDPGMVKDHVRYRKPLREKRVPLSDDEVNQILNEMLPKYRGYYTMILQNGIRLRKEALGLKVRDVDFTKVPRRIIVRAEIAKTKTERIVFVDVDTANYIARYNIKGKGPDDLIFDFSYSAFTQHFGRIRNKLNMNERYANGWNYKINPYKARKYARTKLSEGGGKDFAETIIGHYNISNLYYESSDDNLAETFQRVIDNKK